MRKYSFFMYFERICIDWIISPLDRIHQWGNMILVFSLWKYFWVLIRGWNRNVCRCSVSFWVRFTICKFQRTFPFHLSCWLYWFHIAHSFPKLICWHLEAQKMDDNLISCADHFIMYKNMESLCRTLETNVILYVNYTWVKKNDIATPIF